MNTEVKNETKTEADIIRHLVEIGFTLNKHRDRYDLGQIGVYFDDNDMVVIGFEGKAGWSAVCWRSTLSLSMPSSVIIACLAALKI